MASQHAVISDFILAEQPDTRGRSPWHTAFTNAVCFVLDDNKRQVKDKGKRQSGWFGCEKEGNGKQQTKLGFKSIRRVINKTTNHHLSSHDAKAEHIHSTSVVLGASGHLWCHEKRCAHTTCHGHACLHRLHCSCFSKVRYPVLLCCDAFILSTHTLVVGERKKETNFDIG